MCSSKTPKGGQYAVNDFKGAARKQLFLRVKCARLQKFTTEIQLKCGRISHV